LANAQQSHDPFSDPQNWKENNPYRGSVTSGNSSTGTGTQRSRSSSARQSSRGTRPRPHAPRHSSADVVQQRRPRKVSHIPGPDTIDRLGTVVGTPYHLDGPYEATLAARQIPGRAPVDALKESNAATLAATPAASIRDCLEHHYPLQGTAMFPPGAGGLAEYEEYDVMVRDGNYKRWDHIVSIRHAELDSKGLH
jgi:hypothetical protein